MTKPLRNSWDRLTGMTVPERVQTDAMQAAFAVISQTLELIWSGL